jgi:hypothetical protein
MLAAVTTWEKQHEHTLCLIMSQEFFFRSLTKRDVQNFAQQHLDIKMQLQLVVLVLFQYTQTVVILKSVQKWA